MVSTKLVMNTSLLLDDDHPNTGDRGRGSVLETPTREFSLDTRAGLGGQSEGMWSAQTINLNSLDRFFWARAIVQFLYII